VGLCRGAFRAEHCRVRDRQQRFTTIKDRVIGAWGVAGGTVLRDVAVAQAAIAAFEALMA